MSPNSHIRTISKKNKKLNLSTILRRTGRPEDARIRIGIADQCQGDDENRRADVARSELKEH